MCSTYDWSLAVSQPRPNPGAVGGGHDAGMVSGGHQLEPEGIGPAQQTA